MATTPPSDEGPASQGEIDAPVRRPRSRCTAHTHRLLPRAARPAAAPSPDIQSLLDARRDAYGAPGALALLARGERRWFASSGTADTAGTPITETTRFRIASITKPIVAALVLDAVDRGEVALDDVVGDLLPGTVREDPPITVRQLLDHTSGVFDITNDQTTAESLQADIARLPDKEIRAEAQAGT